MAINNMLGTTTGATLIVSSGITFSDLSGAGSVPLISAVTNGQYRVLDININFGGTNFSGGDRNLSITDGTKVYSVIPAATLQALVNGKWGSTDVPLPTASSMNALTAQSANLVATYSGGTTDYTAGQVTLTVTYQFMGLVGA